MTNEHAEQLAPVIGLQALGWALAAPDRANRLLALTGLDPQQLRVSADDPATLAAVLGLIESHEPDLLGCAAALGITPAALVQARQILDDR